MDTVMPSPIVLLLPLSMAPPHVLALLLALLSWHAAAAAEVALLLLLLLLPLSMLQS